MHQPWGSHTLLELSSCFTNQTQFRTEPTQSNKKHWRMKSVVNYQPHHKISIDKRMVRSKQPFSFGQYISNKQAKWGGFQAVRACV